MSSGELIKEYQFKALALFDLDGTLIASGINNGGHAKAVFKALDVVCGIRGASLGGIDYHGLTDTQVVYALLAKYGMDKDIGHDKLFAIFSEMAGIYRAEMQAANINIYPLPGVVKLLSTLLRHGVLLGVVTGSSKGIARHKLRNAGLARNFWIRQFGDEALSRSDLVRMALKKNDDNHFAPIDRIFLFGDTKRDIETGKIVGVKTIGVATGMVSKAELEKAAPDYLLDDLTNTAHLLKIVLG